MAIKTEQDLQELIEAGTQENLSLEYKRCAALQNDNDSRNELSKDVSAFANSAGGELVYGVIEQNHLPVGIEGFDPAGPIKREWIEQVINSRIQPRIQDIVIRPIALAGANAGRFAFALEIPQSHTAHQASDKKYYKRRNFLAEPMEDYEIRDVFNRAKTPLIELGIRATRRGASAGGRVDYALEVRLVNRGDVSARTIRLELGIPTDLIGDSGMGHDGYLDVLNRRGGRGYRERLYAYQKDKVIFPQQELVLGNWGIIMPGITVSDARTYDHARSYGAEIHWTIYADDMRRQQGQIAVFPDLLDY